MLMPRGAHVAFRVRADDATTFLVERDLITREERVVYEMKPDGAELVIVQAILDLVSCRCRLALGREETHDEFWDELTAMFQRVHDALPDNRE